MRARGFTLIELMIVVAIIGVLAVIGTTAYSRYSHKARASEAYAMIAEIRSKEEAYRTEYSVYCSSNVLAATGTCTTITPEAQVWPALFSQGNIEPRLKPVTPLTLRPPGWLTLGLNPGGNGLYCGYNVNAGANAQSYAQVGTYGTNLFSTAPPTGAFWYVVAECDVDGNVATAPSTWVTGLATQAIAQYNEGQ